MDIWTNHTPYPFNQLPKTYSFMVRNSLIWRIGYYGQQPRFIHVPTQTVSSLFVSRQVGEAFDRYRPDLVVSVHPLMQLVPLRVLRQQARRAGTDPLPSLGARSAWEPDLSWPSVQGPLCSKALG